MPGPFIEQVTLLSTSSPPLLCLPDERSRQRPRREDGGRERSRGLAFEICKIGLYNYFAGADPAVSGVPGRGTGAAPRRRAARHARRRQAAIRALRRGLPAMQRRYAIALGCEISMPQPSFIPTG
jgi:hypothetical protein